MCKEAQAQSTTVALMLFMENDGAIFLGLSFKHETVYWAYCPMPNFAGVDSATLPTDPAGFQLRIYGVIDGGSTARPALHYRCMHDY